MLKLKDDILINEFEIVAAQYVESDKRLILTFTSPVTFASQVDGNPNQIMLSGSEAQNVWNYLSKDAEDIKPKPRVSPGQPKAGGPYR
jgi:hypothetical protein